MALAEGAEAIVLDVAGPHPATVPLPEVRALAEGRGRVPAWTDPALQRAVVEALEGEPAARSAHLDPCAGADARLTVVVDPGSTRPRSVLASPPHWRAGRRSPVASAASRSPSWTADPPVRLAGCG